MDHFPPLEAAATERIHASFAKQGAMTTLGARLTHLARGRRICALTGPRR